MTPDLATYSHSGGPQTAYAVDNLLSSKRLRDDERFDIAGPHVQVAARTFGRVSIL